MDTGRTTRKYPSYTTAQLKAFVAEGVTELRSAEKVADIAAEVTRREDGASVHRSTPVVHGGFVIPRLGRM